MKSVSLKPDVNFVFTSEIIEDQASKTTEEFHPRRARRCTCMLPFTLQNDHHCKLTHYFKNSIKF